MKPTNCNCNSCELDVLLEELKEPNKVYSYINDMDWEVRISDYKSYGIVTTYYSPDKWDSEIVCKNCILKYKEDYNET